jgi:hypothetical protein
MRASPGRRPAYARTDTRVASRVPSAARIASIVVGESACTSSRRDRLAFFTRRTRFCMIRPDTNACSTQSRADPLPERTATGPAPLARRSARQRPIVSGLMSRSAMPPGTCRDQSSHELLGPRCGADSDAPNAPSDCPTTTAGRARPRSAHYFVILSIYRIDSPSQRLAHLLLSAEVGRRLDDEQDMGAGRAGRCFPFSHVTTRRIGDQRDVSRALSDGPVDRIVDLVEAGDAGRFALLPGFHDHLVELGHLLCVLVGVPEADVDDGTIG